MKQYLLTLFFTLPTIYCLSCDCIIYSNKKQYLKTVDHVFIGKVVELVRMKELEYELPEFLKNQPDSTYNRDMFAPKLYYAKVIITSKIKNSSLPKDTILFISDFSDCDPKYELGAAFLFFANQTKNGNYKMAHCTPWGKIEDSQELINELKN